MSSSKNLDDWWWMQGACDKPRWYKLLVNFQQLIKVWWFEWCCYCCVGKVVLLFLQGVAHIPLYTGR